MKTHMIKTNLKLTKNIICLITVGILAIGYSTSLQAQIVRDHRTKVDPFIRLKKLAEKGSVKKSKLASVTIAKNNPNWKRAKKSPIKHIPFENLQENGKPYPKNHTVTLKNGKRMTSQAYLKEINALEKKLNNEGRSLRDKERNTKFVTNRNVLDGRRALAGKSVAPFKKEKEVQQFMSLQQVVTVPNPTGRPSRIVLKPYSSYTTAERSKIGSYDFSVSKGKVTAKKKKRESLDDFIEANRVNRRGNISSLYEHNKVNKKIWSFGNPDLFQAKLEGSLLRYAKIYPFDPERIGSNKSEFRVKASGVATGTILGLSIDILNSSAEFYAPSNVNKVMTATISIKAFNTHIFPRKTYTFPEKKSLSKKYGKSFDKSFPLRIPVLPGIDFKGLLGIKGDVGFEYEGRIERTLASVHAKPIVNLEGYGEGGLSFLGVAEGGVESNLTFIKGELELNAHAGIFNQNSENIVVGVTHYFGYNLEFLSGSINAYGKICSPVPIPFLPDCYREEVELFKWNGFKKSGTITQGGFTPITLENVFEYNENPVFTTE